MADRVSRLELARLVSGDLTAAESDALRRRIDDDPLARHELATLERNATDYASRAPEKLNALRQQLAANTAQRTYQRGLERAALTGRRGTERRGRWRFVAFAGPLAALAAALLLVIVTPEPDDSANPPTVAFKGSLALRVVAKRGAQQFVVKAGDRLFAGDALRFLLTVDRPGFVTVFSLDGRGALSPFYPESSPQIDRSALRLARAGQHRLAGSVVLDDAPGREHLVVVFSSRPFDRRVVHHSIAKALRRNADRPLSLAPASWTKGSTVRVLTVTKAATRGAETSP